MNIKANRELKSSTEEKFTCEMSWDPNNESESGLVALVGAIIDLVNNYSLLNSLVDDDNGQEDL